jgi:hypothetical protein
MATRAHIVVTVAALLTGVAGAAVYLLLSGERGGLEFLGWVVMITAVSYPSLLVAVRSQSQDRCSVWLRRFATGG